MSRNGVCQGHSGSDYYQLDPSDFDLAFTRDGISKFHHLTHSQVLTIVHQLEWSAKLEIFWRVMEKIQVFVEQRFVYYFMDHIQKISRLPVKLREVPLSEQMIVEEESQQRDISWPSYQGIRWLLGPSSFRAYKLKVSWLVLVQWKLTMRLLNVSYAVGLGQI